MPEVTDTGGKVGIEAGWLYLSHGNQRAFEVRGMRSPGLPWTQNKSIISAVLEAWMFRFSHITAIACKTLNELLFCFFLSLFLLPQRVGEKCSVVVLRFIDQLRGTASMRLAPGPAELGTLMGS